MSDQPMRDFAAGTPMPDMGTLPWTPPRAPLSECRVAIVTTAALHTVGDDGFAPDDTSFRVLPDDRRDLVLGHWSPTSTDRASSPTSTSCTPSTGSPSSPPRA